MAVYRGMDQATLERQYNARASVDDFEGEMLRYRELSDQSYASCHVVRDIAYGDQADERFDFFPAGKGAPILVFIHGGYWRFLGRPDSAFMAQNLVGNGVAVAVVEYTLAPAATLDQIVDQIRRAIVSIRQHAAGFDADPERLHVCGSSAGAHLAAMAMITDWESRFGLPVDVIKGAVLVSGLFDLEPVRLCLPNEWLRLDAESAARNSPALMTPPAGVEVKCFWGELETDEFKRQSLDFANTMTRHGVIASASEVPDRNHFNVITDLADSSSLMCQELFEMVELPRTNRP